MFEGKRHRHEVCSFPFALNYVEADNCVRETKNQWNLKMGAYLLATGKTRLFSLLFGRVGHMHGSLGALVEFICFVRRG